MTVIDPLALWDANDPGEMTMLSAPVVTQLSVALAPVPTVPGLAVNEVIAGMAFASDPAKVTGAVQPASKAQVIAMTASAQSCGRADLSMRKPYFRPEKYRSKKLESISHLFLRSGAPR